MFKVFKKIAKEYERYMTYRGRDIARQYLLQCDDRMLEDNGFSRALLNKGVNAWPWRTMEEQEHLFTAAVESVSAQQTMKNLASMSDAELHDLGISRASIKEAVISDHPGEAINSRLNAA